MIEEGTRENITIQNAIRKYKIDKTTTGEEFNFKMLIKEIKATITMNPTTTSDVELTEKHNK
jgi:hypothetical protein